MTEGIRIHRLRIVNYRGVEALDVPIPEAGGVFAGANMQGKTSILRGIRAALAARDISPDAIRFGADRAEILVDLGHVTAQRVITAEGSKLTVKQGGAEVKKPQTWLTELLGTSPLDPLELFLERDKVKRRQLVLKALPMKVTIEQVREWVGDEMKLLVEMGGAEPRVLEQHGLEAIKEIHGKLYDCRAYANKCAKEAAELVRSLETQMEPHKGVAVADLGAMEQATKDAASAREALAALQAKDDAVASALTRDAKAREQIGTLRDEATKLEGEAATLRTTAHAKLPAAHETLKALRAKLTDAKAEVARLEDEVKAGAVLVKSFEDGIDKGETLDTTAQSKKRQATDWERTLTPADARPTVEELATAIHLRDSTAKRVSDTTAGAAVAALKTKLEAARTEEKDRQTTSGKLTTVLDKLTHAAPMELIMRSKGIPGLGLNIDGGITLNGVEMDALSGREQVKFAVDVAKRLNEKARILVVDGLERLDGAQRVHFVDEATRGGFQLIGTRVEDGDVVFEAIEPCDEPVRGPSQAEAEAGGGC